MAKQGVQGQTTVTPLTIDLSGLDIKDVQLFSQEGARALPEMAASCACNTVSCCSSCGPAGGVATSKS